MKYFRNFDNDLTVEKIRSELVSLEIYWGRLKNSISEEYTVNDGSDDENERE